MGGDGALVYAAFLYLCEVLMDLDCDVVSVAALDDGVFKHWGRVRHGTKSEKREVWRAYFEQRRRRASGRAPDRGG